MKLSVEAFHLVQKHPYQLLLQHGKMDFSETMKHFITFYSSHLFFRPRLDTVPAHTCVNGSPIAAL